jgi:hypothetical protein
VGGRLERVGVSQKKGTTPGQGGAEKPFGFFRVGEHLIESSDTGRSSAVKIAKGTLVPGAPFRHLDHEGQVLVGGENPDGFPNVGKVGGVCGPGFFDATG